MDSHKTTNFFGMDGLPNFLRYGAPLACLWCAGVPLSRTCLGDVCKTIYNLTLKSMLLLHGSNIPFQNFIAKCEGEL